MLDLINIFLDLDTRSGEMPPISNSSPFRCTNRSLDPSEMYKKVARDKKRGICGLSNAWMGRICREPVNYSEEQPSGSDFPIFLCRYKDMRIGTIMGCFYGENNGTLVR